MTPRGRTGGKTPERVVNLVKDAVAASSQSAVARESGLGLLTIQRCLKGIGEPTQATLEKLAAYFKVSVAWLRGDYDDIEKSIKRMVRILGGDIYTSEEGDSEYIRELFTDVFLKQQANGNKYKNFIDSFSQIPNDEKNGALDHLLYWIIDNDIHKVTKEIEHRRRESTSLAISQVLVPTKKQK